MTVLASDEHAPGFEHHAFFYRHLGGYVDGVGSFIAAGVRASEPVLVAVDEDKIAALRSALGSDARRVEFVDMRSIGGNPARIIDAWEQFVQERGTNGRPLRGVGEPVWPGRTAAEIVECEIHEHLLNVAFADGQPWSLLCPYDASGLAPETLASARRSHPTVVDGRVRQRSHAYEEIDVFAASLPEPIDTMCDIRFIGDELVTLRQVVFTCACRAGLDDGRAADVVLAVHELAANSVVHGGGRGRLRAWTDDGSLVVEVRDGGRIDAPLVGRERPLTFQPRGRGLWMVNQLCDLLQLRSDARGSVARVYVRR